MNQKQIEIIKQQLHITAGRVTTNSLSVAGAFDKEHYNVLRDIEALECSAEFRALNFEGTSYEVAGPNNSSRQAPAYELTKDGFMFLAMGYTGKLAALIKEAYIAAFNQMERLLCSNMAEARDQAASAMAAIIAASARAGNRADFIPMVIHLRKSGLSCAEAGKVLGVHGSTVASWSRRLRGAGMDLPNLERSIPAYLQSSARQLALPGVAI